MNFTFSVTVPIPAGGVDSAALGVSPAEKFVAADVGKPVKLAAANNYVLAADGDDLEGVCIALAPNTVNDGFSFGSVQRKFTGLEVSNGGAGPLAVRDTVVCGAQAALGTAQSYPVVKAGAGTLYKWRVKSLLSGTGAVGQTVLIEQV